MKKILLIGLALGITVPMFADTPKPMILPEFYTRLISSDGSVVVSQAETSGAYNLATNEYTDLGEYYPGNGNCISANGSLIVGSIEEEGPVIFKNGEPVDLTKFISKYGKDASFNAVTGDGTIVIGSMANTSVSGPMSIPFIATLSEDGVPGNVTILPYPEKDWLNHVPQFVTASFISNDGNIILGQVMDNSGMHVYPILYKKGTDNKWSYSLPAESLVNPNKIPYPEAPEEFTLVPPEYKDYMTPEQLSEYEVAYDAWQSSGFTLPYPEPGDFMDPDKKIIYETAVQEYDQAVFDYYEKSEEYDFAMSEIELDSTFFFQNGQAMSPDGKTVAMCSEKLVIIDGEMGPDVDVIYPTYLLDTESGELKEIKLVDNYVMLPHQVLSDGTVVSSTPANSLAVLPPTSWLVLPGTDEYISLEKHLEAVNPEGAAWLQENFTQTILVNIDIDTQKEIYETIYMTGHVCISDNWSVMSGGVIAYMYSNEHAFESYVIFSTPSGIENIEAGAEAEVKSKTFYDLNGIEVKTPGKGIYVVRTEYSDGNVVTSKVAVTK